MVLPVSIASTVVLCVAICVGNRVLKSCDQIMAGSASVDAANAVDGDSGLMMMVVVVVVVIVMTAV